MNANEVSIKITGTNASSPAVDGAKRGMDQLKDKATETSARVRVLGESVSSTTRKTDDLGDKARKTTRELSALDRKILELRASTLALGREFEKSGDTSLLKKFRADSRELSGLERMRKQIGGLSGDVKDLGKEAASTATTFTSLFQGGAISALKSPAGAAVAAPFAAGAVINAGALAGGALTAGVGAGVAGAGIAGAATQSKAVQDAWARTTTDIKNRFLDATTSFEQPTIAAIRRIGGAVRDIHMDKIFGDASKFVEPLADSGAKAVGAIGRGVEALVSKGGPAIRATGDAVEAIATGVEHAMEKIAGGSEGGAKAIHDLGSAIGSTVEDIGTFIRWTENAYDALDDLRKLAENHPFIGALYDVKGTDKVSELGTTTLGLSIAAGTAADSYYTLDQRIAMANKRMQDQIDAVDRLNTGFEHMFGILASVDEATIRYQQSIDDLASNWDKAGKSLDANTQAGRDNLELIERTIQAIDAQREAAVRAGGGTEEAYDAANAAYLQQLKNLRAQLAALGANTAAVDALIAKYEELAKPLTKHVTVVIDQVGSVSREGVVSGGDQRRRTGAAYAHGGIVGAASGMVLSGLANVAERGREIALLAPGRAVLPPGSQVIPNGMTENMLAGGGRGQPPIVINVYGSVISERELLTTISNNVKDLGGRPELLGLKAA